MFANTTLTIKLKGIMLESGDGVMDSNVFPLCFVIVCCIMFGYNCLTLFVFSAFKLMHLCLLEETLRREGQDIYVFNHLSLQS